MKLSSQKNNLSDFRTGYLFYSDKQLFCNIRISTLSSFVSICFYKVWDTTIGVKHTTCYIDWSTVVYFKDSVYRTTYPQTCKLTAFNLDVTTSCCSTEETTTSTAISFAVEFTIDSTKKRLPNYSAGVCLLAVSMVYIHPVDNDYFTVTVPV